MTYSKHELEFTFANKNALNTTCHISSSAQPTRCTMEIAYLLQCYRNKETYELTQKLGGIILNSKQFHKPHTYIKRKYISCL